MKDGKTERSKDGKKQVSDHSVCAILASLPSLYHVIRSKRKLQSHRMEPIMYAVSVSNFTRYGMIYDTAALHTCRMWLYG